MTDATRSAEQRAAYGRATTALRTTYAAEFADRLAKEYEAAGLTVKRRLTDEQREQRDQERAAARELNAKAKHEQKVEKARAQLAALLNEDA
jgi:predicted nucleotidyltransferase